MTAPIGADPSAALATANFWIEVCTALVALGVVIELIDLLIFSKEMSKWQRRLLFVASAMVVFGCGGEFVFEKQAMDAEAILQRQSDDKVAALTGAEAADNRIAQQAASTAAALGLKVDALPTFVRQKEDELDRKSNDLKLFANATTRHDNETIAELNRSKITLNAATEDAKAAESRTAKAWENVKKLSVARIITPTQRSVIIPLIKKLKIVDIQVNGYTTDPESLMYANDFVELIKSAGIKSEFNSGGLFSWVNPNRDDDPSTIFIQWGGTDAEAEAIKFLAALKAANIPSKLIPPEAADTKAAASGPNMLFLTVIPKVPRAPTNDER